MALLELRGIGMEYGAIRALAEVDYTVSPGEIVGLIGDNGAGKSTLVKIIAGNFPPTHGTMHFDGHQVRFRGPEDARNAGAKLLNCQPDEVSLVGPTSLALSFVAAGLKFRRGDNVLIYHDDYPSNVYPWMALADQGVQVRLLNTRGLGAIRAVDVMGQVDENTRLVALASCHFISGHRLDHDAIGKFLRERLHHQHDAAL